MALQVASSCFIMVLDRFICRRVLSACLIVSSAGSEVNKSSTRVDPAVTALLKECTTPKPPKPPRRSAANSSQQQSQQQTQQPSSQASAMASQPPQPSCCRKVLLSHFGSDVAPGHDPERAVRPVASLRLCSTGQRGSSLVCTFKRPSAQQSAVSSRPDCQAHP